LKQHLNLRIASAKAMLDYCYVSFL
jgi:hypothetical protein